MFMMKVILLLVCVVVASAAKSYRGYKVLEVVPVDQKHVEILHSLSDDIELDFWTEFRAAGLPVRIMMPSHKVGHVIDHIEDNGMDFKIINHDVGAQVEKEKLRLNKKNAFDINDFNTYDDIMTELDAMAGRCPAALTCTVQTLGNSYEGQAIKVLRISAGSASTGVWMDSAIHAREWLAPATVLKIMDHFTRDYGTDPDVTNLIDSYDWHFVPVMNPDGYEFTFSDDRYWRKSRNENQGSACMGTDLNRNYDSHWSSDGTSTNPCSDTFHGAGPASEPETQVIQNELLSIGSTLRALVSVHTAAQMWLHPWGYTEPQGGPCARAPDHDDLYQVAVAAADATEDTYGTRWTRGTICETIYPASGTTCDFGREGANIKFSYTPELRGPDFVTEPSEIELSFQEFYNGVKAMVSEMETIPLDATPK